MSILRHTFLVLVIAAICGCGKKGEPVSELYTIAGLSDISVRQFSDTTFTAVYHVAYPAGLYELVTLNIEDVPPGVIVSPRFATDTTSFSVMVTYKVLMTVAASYKVGMTLYSGSQGKKKFTFRINVTEAPAFGYTLSLPPDIILPRYADTILRLPVTATYKAGTNEVVTITPSDLPAFMSASPAAITGTPSFTDTLALHVTANEVSGNRVVLHATSSQGIQAAGFNVNIEAQDNCAPVLADTFSGNTVCNTYSGPGTGYSTVSTTVYGNNKIVIDLPFADAVTELNCTNATLNMLPGSGGSLVFAGGTGTFSANTIVLHYALSGAINSACTTTLSR